MSIVYTHQDTTTSIYQRSGHINTGPYRSGHIHTDPHRSGHTHTGPYRSGHTHTGPHRLGHTHTDQDTHTLVHTDQDTFTPIHTDQDTLTLVYTDQDTLTLVHTDQDTLTLVHTDQDTLTLVHGRKGPLEYSGRQQTLLAVFPHTLVCSEPHLQAQPCLPPSSYPGGGAQMLTDNICFHSSLPVSLSLSLITSYQLNLKSTMTPSTIQKQSLCIPSSF